MAQGVTKFCQITFIQSIIVAGQFGTSVARTKLTPNNICVTSFRVNLPYCQRLQRFYTKPSTDGKHILGLWHSRNAAL